MFLRELNIGILTQAPIESSVLVEILKTSVGPLVGVLVGSLLSIWVANINFKKDRELKKQTMQMGICFDLQAHLTEVMNLISQVKNYSGIERVDAFNYSEVLNKSRILATRIDDTILRESLCAFMRRANTIAQMGAFSEGKNLSEEMHVIVDLGKLKKEHVQLMESLGEKIRSYYTY